jgi:hypothetical protein
MRLKGVWVAGAAYEVGDVVIRKGFWLCTESATAARPGAGDPGWTLILKDPKRSQDQPAVTPTEQSAHAE